MGRRSTPPGDGTKRQVIVPLTDLNRAPDGPRDRQLLLGDNVTVYEDTSGHSYLQSAKDGYCGYVASDALGAASPATHRVRAPSCHVYEQDNIKSKDLMTLSLGSHLTVLSETERFLETGFGFIPKTHLAPVGNLATDTTEIALLFLGTPYLWGGNSRFGIDCSGLVQAAYLACGISCPGDSDQQCRDLGTQLPSGTPVRKGDLLFWAGHVALALGPNTLIHANAHHMAVVSEDIDTTVSRISEQGDGPVTAHKRP